MDGLFTNVGAVDEAKEVEQRHGWDDEEVDFQPQLAFGNGVVGNEGFAISATDDTY